MFVGDPTFANIVAIVTGDPSAQSAWFEDAKLRMLQAPSDNVDPFRPASLILEAIRELAGNPYVLPEDPGRTRTLVSLHVAETLANLDAEVWLSFELPFGSGDPLFLHRHGVISVVNTPGDPASGYATVATIRQRIEALLP